MFPIKFTFTENGIDFIVFQYQGKHWMLCFDGVSHGSSICRLIEEGFTDPNDCYIAAKNYKGKPRYW